MGLAAFLWLYAATDFWRGVTNPPYDAAVEQGTRLSRQAEQVCPACSEEAPRFAEMQALWRQAAAAFRRAAALHPEDAEPAYFAAHALYEARDYEAAIAQLAEARRRSPNGARAFDVAFDLGTAHSRLGRLQRAVDEYNRALHLSQDPFERAVLYVNTAESMMALGRLEEAIALYRRGVELGQIGLRSGAMSSASQALHLLGLAVALDRDEQEEKGLFAARRALELDPQVSSLHDPHVFFVPDGDITYYEAVKELAQGHRAEAARWFTQFLRVVPQSAFAARARAHLRALGVRPEPPTKAVPSSVPSWSLGVVSSIGPLSAPELAAALKQHWAAIAECMAGVPDWHDIEVTVSARGRVSKLLLKPAAAGAEGCLRESARGWRFRTPDHPRSTRLVLRVRGTP